MTSRLFVRRCLVGAGASFLGMAAICILLYPEIFKHYEYGVSYFGSVSATAIPYYLGFGAAITFVALIAKKLQHVDKLLSAAFYAFAVCMTGVAVTSYSLNHLVYAIHWGFAIALTLCLLAAIFWLVRQGGLTLLEHAVICIVAVTIILSSLPIIHDIPGFKYYVPRELLVFVGSLWLLGRAAIRTTERDAGV